MSIFWSRVEMHARMSHRGVDRRPALHNTCLYVCVLWKQIRWLKVLVPLSAHPHQNNTQTKSDSQHFYTLINGHKEQKNDGRGAAQRCTETPALSPLLCWRMARSQSSCCWLHGTFETTPFTRKQSLELWACRLQGMVVVGVGWGAHKTKGTLCQIKVERTAHSSRRSAAGVGGGLKVKEEAFKVDSSHISHSTKESQRWAIWTQPHHLPRDRSEKFSHSQ